MLADAPLLLHEKFIARFDALNAQEQKQILDALKQVAVMMDAADIDAAPLLDLNKPI